MLSLFLEEGNSDGLDEVELLNRVDLIRALLDHQQKAEVNSQALELAGPETLCALFITWNLIFNVQIP